MGKKENMSERDRLIHAINDHHRFTGRLISALNHVAYHVQTSRDALEATIESQHGMNYTHVAHEKISYACEEFRKFLDRERSPA